MENQFKGVKAAPGIAYAKAFVRTARHTEVLTQTITVAQVEEEKQKYAQAVKSTETQMTDSILSAKRKFGEDKAAEFEAHMEVLTDPELTEKVYAKIEHQLKTAELALSEAMKEIVTMFLQVDDAYLRERVEDIRDVCGRILQNMQGSDLAAAFEDELQENVIIVAQNLTPADTATMDLTKVKGFVTDEGGATAHVVILAKSFGLPAAVGMGKFSDKVKTGDFILLDGLTGNVWINPEKEIVDQYKIKKEDFAAHRKLLEELILLPAETADGKHVELSANIGGVKDIARVLKYGADGIGLFRTEFLYMENTHFPTEEEQFEAYKEVALAMGDKPVIFRTLDIGGDKELPYFKFDYEMNPFLGCRAVRFGLNNPEIFKTQLRAILRASAFGKLRIMFPMIGSVTELRTCRNILETCMAELTQEQVVFDEKMPVGIMVELPAAIIMADTLAKECDFFSIGTNDLTQYILAVDRGNEKVSHMYNSFAPAVLISIKKVIDAAHKAGKWVGMCGEMAADERAIPLLVGLGLDELSVNTSSLLTAKDIIRKANSAELMKMAEKVLECEAVEEVMKLL